MYLQEGDFGVNGVAVLSFSSRGNFNARYRGIILPGGMRFFMLLADGIR